MIKAIFQVILQDECMQALFTTEVPTMLTTVGALSLDHLRYYFQRSGTHKLHWYLGLHFMGECDSEKY